MAKKAECKAAHQEGITSPQRPATSPFYWPWMARLPSPRHPHHLHHRASWGHLPPHRDALQHRGLRPANLRRLLCDVILTTVLLHKRHAVPILPLAAHLSPLTGDPVNQSLANSPPPEWYHVTNWTPTPGSSRWPAWDVILGLWLSRDLLLAPAVKSTIATRSKRSPYRVLYVHLKSHRMPPNIRQEVDLEAHDVIILDSLGRHGLAPHFPHRYRLWAIHYSGDRRGPTLLEDEDSPGSGRTVASGATPLRESGREPPMVVGAKERVERARKDVVARGRQKTEGAGCLPGGGTGKGECQ